MKNPYSFSYRCMLALLAASLVLCAHAQQSSIYLDSRDVADYIRNVQEPYIDASKVRSIQGVKVFRFNSKKPLVFDANRRLPIPEEGIYTLVWKDLEETDTVFVVGSVPLPPSVPKTHFAVPFCSVAGPPISRNFGLAWRGFCP